VFLIAGVFDCGGDGGGEMGKREVGGSLAVFEFLCVYSSSSVCMCMCVHVSLSVRTSVREDVQDSSVGGHICYSQRGHSLFLTRLLLHVRTI
jgi:hypothetical protein